METLVNNRFITIEYHSDQSLVYYEWKAASEELLFEAFFGEASMIAEAIVKKKPKFVIGNDLNFKVMIDPDSQAKIQTELISLINDIISQYIHILSEDVFSQVTVEMTFDKNSGIKFENTYVKTKEEAMKLI